MRPEESGATLMGPLLIREQTRRGEREIHCQEDVGTGGYQIPNNPDMIEFLDDDIDFALAVETGGMRDRLVENGFDEAAYNCLVIHPQGASRRGRLAGSRSVHDELDVPVAVFADGDPWSYRIYGSVAYGSIKSAHLSKYLATPEAQLGIQPEDIVEYDLPADPLADSDITPSNRSWRIPDSRPITGKNRSNYSSTSGRSPNSSRSRVAGSTSLPTPTSPERLDAMGVI